MLAEEICNNCLLGNQFLTARYDKQVALIPRSRVKNLLRLIVGLSAKLLNAAIGMLDHM